MAQISNSKPDHSFSISDLISIIIEIHLWKGNPVDHFGNQLTIKEKKKDFNKPLMESA